MKKVLVFIYDEMADFEFTFVSHLLGTLPDWEIIIIAYEENNVRSMSGVEYRPSRLVRDVIDEDVDGLILPGGYKGEIRPELIELIKNVHRNGKLLAAICAGPRFLAKAGILEKVKYTTSITEWTEIHEKRYGDECDPLPRKNFVNERVVSDGNVITATGAAFVDFSVEICDWFKLFKDKEEKDEFVKSMKG